MSVRSSTPESRSQTLMLESQLALAMSRSCESRLLTQPVWPRSVWLHLPVYMQKSTMLWAIYQC